MKGRSHIVVAPASVYLASKFLTSLQEGNIAIVSQGAHVIAQLLDFHSAPWWLSCVAGALLILGSLAPDTDSKTSLLGRFIHIPVEHRTYTHTIWVPLGVTIASLIAQMLHPFFAIALRWFAVGYISHLFWDSFSKTGFYWFYPLQQYERSSKGVRIKANHRAILYSTGSKSEYILVDAIVVLAIIVAILVQ
ncbi:MAG: metal-dependent hydrolase [Eggerthellaceae bacterium]|nr:metal-dependent hydrolase [Eggerthellaceae bacterium]